MPSTVPVDVRFAPCRLDVVDALARLELAARRRGVRIVVVGASADLRALIELAGLSDVLPVEPRR
ncbi:MAG TPA: hypothetical protein VFA05_00650 [Gaiellaceae bacterium]|nr:hypothetical protein [Gaiellaceae bacterium]